MGKTSTGATVRVGSSYQYGKTMFYVEKSTPAPGFYSGFIFDPLRNGTIRASVDGYKLGRIIPKSEIELAERQARKALLEEGRPAPSADEIAVAAPKKAAVAGKAAGERLAAGANEATAIREAAISAREALAVFILDEDLMNWVWMNKPLAAGAIKRALGALMALEIE